MVPGLFFTIQTNFLLAEGDSLGFPHTLAKFLKPPINLYCVKQTLFMLSTEKLPAAVNHDHLKENLLWPWSAPLNNNLMGVNIFDSMLISEILK